MDVELAMVGQRIGELRTANGWRLADLAEATGYTTSYLSQIERGVSLPSLTALATIAIALGVEMITLLDAVDEPSVTINRASDGRRLRLEDGRWFNIIGPFHAERGVTLMTQRLPPEPASYRHFGERFLLVLRGEVELSFGEEVHQVGPLGTVHYGAHEPHLGHALTDDTEVLIASCPALI